MTTLEQITLAANNLLAQNKVIEEQEERLKQLKNEARVLREETIPNAMVELGLKDFTLESGQKLTISQEVYASIPKDSKASAFEWLNEHGFGGLIKTEVKTSYGKGDREKALSLTKWLCGEGLDANFSESVHASTLKAFIKEQIRNGNAIPLDLFGASPVMIAKIK